MPDTVIIGDPRPSGEEGPAGDQRATGEHGPAGDPRPAGDPDTATMSDHVEDDRDIDVRTMGDDSDEPVTYSVLESEDEHTIDAKAKAKPKR